MQNHRTDHIIDVVEDFQCPYQTDKYRDALRKWRRRDENRYAFRATRNPRESSFSDSVRITEPSPSKTEQEVLYRLGYLIGCAMVLYFTVENILDKVIVWLLNAMGMDIQMLFWGTNLYGDERHVFLVVVLINALKYLIPLAVLQRFLRLPLAVSMPSYISSLKEFLLGVVLTMMLSVGCGLFSVTNSNELEKYKLICNAVGVDDTRMILYTLFTVLVMPILIELLLHGAMFQVLRQFGDSFAILAVTLLSAVIMHSLEDALRIAIMTMTFSYFVIRTGSFWTAVFLHIVHEIYMFTLFYIETFEDVFTLWWWIMMLLPCVIGILVGVYMLFHEPETERSDPKNTTFLKMSDKCITFFSSFPMIGTIVISIVLMLASALLSM
ncbi:MAG: CPBP family intramembrane metalloprotease [Oscillospiraceae bacterium]|nr:CPBP family intramembrane metalloprotease [Oscillospiraceae bacterium]